MKADDDAPSEIEILVLDMYEPAWLEEGKGIGGVGDDLCHVCFHLVQLFLDVKVFCDEGFIVDVGFILQNLERLKFFGDASVPKQQ